LTDDKNMVGEVYYPKPEVIASAYIQNYDEINESAKGNLARFWRKIATESFEWYKPWETILDDTNAPFFKWFVGAKVNLVHNALDRHMRTAVRNKAALIFEGEPGDVRVYTYRQLNHEVCKFASVLRSMGVAKGDPVTIFMGRIPELIIAMLACVKIGAMHSVVDSGASSDILKSMIQSSLSKMLICSDGGWLRGNVVDLKKIVNQSIDKVETLQSVICVRRTEQEVEMIPGRDYWYHELMALSIADPKAPTEIMDAEDPLFILYSLNSAESLHAVLHSHGGYMVGTYTTLKWVFDIKPEDVWWCTSDPSNIIGHSYVVFSPLIMGATSFLYEGVPTYPYPDRWWQMVAKYSITKMHTSPADIRNLMRYGASWPQRHDLSSLRLLGSAGETLNPEAWKWFYQVIGKERCPIIDSWLQKETGGFVLTSLPGSPLKPGSPGRPFPGIQIDVVDEDGKSLPPGEEGFLVIQTSWPAMFRTLYEDTDQYVDRYWNGFPEQVWYMPGEKVWKDEDGYFWINGRAD